MKAKAAAKQLGISYQHLYWKLIKLDAIKIVKIGRNIMVPQAEIDRFIAEGGVEYVRE